MTPEMRLKKAHVRLMNHPETALYSGIILMGQSTVVDNCPTAYTDGFNKRYGRKFIETLTDEELRALVLHENLHVALNHAGRFKREFRKNPQLMNICADYVVNDVIVHLEDKSLCKLPEGGLYEEKYHNWSVNEILRDLKQQMSERSDSGSGGTGDGTQGDDESVVPQNSQCLPDGLKPLDEHDFNGDSPVGVSSQEEMTQAIENALKEGGIIASRLGVKQPRAIAELFEPKIDWRQALREFVQSSVRGSDEYTWRKFNKRMMANDLYLPTTENESMGELVVAIDTSGSIGQNELTEFATELVAICDTVTPERIRVVWWDYDVHGEQRFNPEDYGSIKSLLKPQGGGGTRVSCVSEYIKKEQVDVEAIVVFTDGYTESDIEWNISTPSLFMVTENKNFTAPPGSTIVFYDN